VVRAQRPIVGRRSAENLARSVAHVHTTVRAHTHRRRTALCFDIPVGVLLLATWLSIGFAVAHLLIGIALAAMVAVHVAVRRRLIVNLLRRASRRPWRTAHDTLLLLMAAAMTITGLLLWAGAEPAHQWHTWTSYLLLTLALPHVWSRRRQLRARLRRTTPTHSRAEGDEPWTVRR
jgi:hypothetical protein